MSGTDPPLGSLAEPENPRLPDQTRTNGASAFCASYESATVCSRAGTASYAIVYAYVHGRSGRCPAYCKWIHEAALCSLYVLFRYRIGARVRVRIMRRLRTMTTRPQTLLGRLRTNCARCTCCSGTEQVANVLGLRSWAGSSCGPCRMPACCMPYSACSMSYAACRMLCVVVDCNVVLRLRSDRKWRVVRSASVAPPASKYRRKDVFGQLPVVAGG